MNNRKIKAQRVAASLRQKHNAKSLPVDIDRITKGEGIALFRLSDLPDEVSGVLDLSRENDPRIFVNATHAPTRQRFTIGHELGHFMLHHLEGVHIDKTFFRDSKSSEAIHRLEIEANFFAAELLMPRENVEIYLDDFVNEDESADLIEILAGRFNVSTIAMTNRLKNLSGVRQ